MNNEKKELARICFPQDKFVGTGDARCVNPQDFQQIGGEIQPMTKEIPKKATHYWFGNSMDDFGLCYKFFFRKKKR